MQRHPVPLDAHVARVLCRRWTIHELPLEAELVAVEFLGRHRTANVQDGNRRLEQITPPECECRRQLIQQRDYSRSRTRSSRTRAARFMGTQSSNGAMLPETSDAMVDTDVLRATGVVVNR